MGTMMADGYVNRIDLDGRSYEVILQVDASSVSTPSPSRATTCIAADGKSIRWAA